MKQFEDVALKFFIFLFTVFAKLFINIGWVIRSDASDPIGAVLVSIRPVKLSFDILWLQLCSWNMPLLALEGVMLVFGHVRSLQSVFFCVAGCLLEYDNALVLSG